jgi:hypothetical protein
MNDDTRWLMHGPVDFQCHLFLIGLFGKHTALWLPMVDGRRPANQRHGAAGGHQWICAETGFEKAIANL